MLLVVFTTDCSTAMVLVLAALVVFTTDRSKAVVLVFAVNGILYY